MMKIKFLIGLLAFFGFVGQGFAAEVFFRPEKVEAKVGEEFLVTLFVAADQPINALEGNLALEGLDLREVRDGNSVVNLWLERPDLVDDVLRFSGLIPTAYAGEQAEVFSLLLVAEESGEFRLGFENVQVLLNDGLGTAADLKVGEGLVKVVEGEMESFVDEPDLLAPEAFTVQVERDPRVFDGDWFLVFTTQDKQSGIEKYEVSEERENRLLDFGWEHWREAESPYLLDDQALKSTIKVKAIDRAGNEVVVEVAAANEPSLVDDPLIFWLLFLLVFGGLYFLTRSRWR